MLLNQYLYLLQLMISESGIKLKCIYFYYILNFKDGSFIYFINYAQDEQKLQIISTLISL